MNTGKKRVNVTIPLALTIDYQVSEHGKWLAEIVAPEMYSFGTQGVGRSKEEATKDAVRDLFLDLNGHLPTNVEIVEESPATTGGQSKTASELIQALYKAWLDVRMLDPEFAIAFNNPTYRSQQERIVREEMIAFQIITSTARTRAPGPCQNLFAQAGVYK